jgi:hypothetical protein
MSYKMHNIDTICFFFRAAHSDHDSDRKSKSQAKQRLNVRTRRHVDISMVLRSSPFQTRACAIVGILGEFV